MSAFGKFTVHPAAEDFPLMDEDRRAELAADIKAHGQFEAIVLTADGTIIADGRNRYLACVDAGIEPKFRMIDKRWTELQIVQFIGAVNAKRRDLDKGQHAVCVLLNQDRQTKLIEDNAKQRQHEGQRAGGQKAGRSRPNRSGPTLGQSKKDSAGRTNRKLASKAGVGHGTIAKGRKVIKHSRGLAKEVAAGQKTLDEAYKDVRNAEQASQTTKETAKPSKTTIILKTHLGEDVPYPLPKGGATFNSTNAQVSWAAWTWNPVTGCLHGCKYCYAREGSANRNLAPFYPVGFTPLFHHERLDAPANTKVPAEAAQDSRLRRVFVCSMADLYGKWVPDEWIEKVHASCIASPQWEYLMLTKFPRRYVGLQLPPTAWLGTSVDEQKRVRLAEEAFREIDGVRVKWLSLEPLLAPLEFTDLSMFDWVVIGAQSATEQPDGIGHVKEFQPKFEWVARLTAQAHEAGCRVYHKPNLLGIPNPQCAGMQLIQEEPILPPLAGRQGDLLLERPAA